MIYIIIGTLFCINI